MSTEIEICNSALAKVGAARILTLSDDTAESRVCSAQYAICRDKLLTSHPWKFALKRASLAALVEVPAFGYDKQFQLPNDWLRTIEVDPVEYDWDEEGRVLLTDATTCSIKYIYKVEDASLFDAVFVEALSYDLASVIAYPLTQSTKLTEDMAGLARKWLAEARSYSAQRGSSKRIVADDFLTARY